MDGDNALSGVAVRDLTMRIGLQRFGLHANVPGEHLAALFVELRVKVDLVSCMDSDGAGILAVSGNPAALIKEHLHFFLGAKRLHRHAIVHRIDALHNPAYERRGVCWKRRDRHDVGCVGGIFHYLLRNLSKLWRIRIRNVSPSGVDGRVF